MREFRIEATHVPAGSDRRYARGRHGDTIVTASIDETQHPTAAGCGFIYAGGESPWNVHKVEREFAPGRLAPVNVAEVLR